MKIERRKMASMIPRYSTTFKAGQLTRKGNINDMHSLTGAKYTFLFSSARAGIVFTLKAYGIKRGDEVIIPSFICNVVPDALLRFGIKPVFVDVFTNPSDIGNIIPNKIENKITEKTKAIIPAHLYGNPYQVDEIHEIAKKYDLVVIEDAAHALGAEYKGEKAGSLGDAACFSFGVGKPVTAGGGCIVTNNDDIANKINSLIFRLPKQGISNELLLLSSLVGTKILLNKHIFPLTYKMWEMFGDVYSQTKDVHFKRGFYIQKKLLSVQIKEFPKILETRRKQWGLLVEILSEVVDLIVPQEAKETKHAGFWFSCYHKKIRGKRRKELLHNLRTRHVDFGVIYPFVAPHIYGINNGYPGSKMLSEAIISIQLGPHLTDNNVIYIAKTLNHEIIKMLK